MTDFSVVILCLVLVRVPKAQRFHKVLTILYYKALKTHTDTIS